MIVPSSSMLAIIKSRSRFREVGKPRCVGKLTIRMTIHIIRSQFGPQEPRPVQMKMDSAVIKVESTRPNGTVALYNIDLSNTTPPSAKKDAVVADFDGKWLRMDVLLSAINTLSMLHMVPKCCPTAT